MLHDAGANRFAKKAPGVLAGPERALLDFEEPASSERLEHPAPVEDDEGVDGADALRAPHRLEEGRLMDGYALKNATEKVRDERARAGALRLEARKQEFMRVPVTQLTG